MLKYLLDIMEEKVGENARVAMEETIRIFGTIFSWALAILSIFGCIAAVITALVTLNALYLLWMLPCLVLTFLGVFGAIFVEGM